MPRHFCSNDSPIVLTEANLFDLLRDAYCSVRVLVQIFHPTELNMNLIQVTRISEVQLLNIGIDHSYRCFVKHNVPQIKLNLFKLLHFRAYCWWHTMILKRICCCERFYLLHLRILGGLNVFRCKLGGKSIQEIYAQSSKMLSTS